MFAALVLLVLLYFAAAGCSQISIRLTLPVFATHQKILLRLGSPSPSTLPVPYIRRLFDAAPVGTSVVNKTARRSSSNLTGSISNSQEPLLCSSRIPPFPQSRQLLSVQKEFQLHIFWQIYRISLCNVCTIYCTLLPLGTFEPVRFKHRSVSQPSTSLVMHIYIPVSSSSQGYSFLTSSLTEHQ